jgi:hypothetical protein
MFAAVSDPFASASGQATSPGHSPARRWHAASRACGIGRNCWSTMSDPERNTGTECCSLAPTGTPQDAAGTKHGYLKFANPMFVGCVGCPFRRSHPHISHAHALACSRREEAAPAGQDGKWDGPNNLRELRITLLRGMHCSDRSVPTTFTPRTARLIRLRGRVMHQHHWAQF